MYDYTIIGAGPTGLTIAWILAKYGNKVLIIERESNIGGCHRVTRVDGLFTEHSPRMYFGNYYGLQMILNDMGHNFNDIFSAYNVGLFNIGYEVIKNLSINEIYCIIKEYLKFMVNKEYSKHITTETFMNNNNFSEKSMNMIDALGRLTDGATMHTYTLYEFLEIVNQNGLYNLYQPNRPNDVGLFNIWEKSLIDTKNIDIYFNSEVLMLENKGNFINSLQITKDNKIINISCNNVIFAIPPKNLFNILIKNNLDAFGEFENYKSWALKSTYLQFIAVTFHWKTKIEFKNKYVIPNTDWLTAHIILSNYMDFSDDRSKTVISACITKPDGFSTYLNKTPNECSEQELIEEVFRQLKLSLELPNLDKPDYSILNPHIFKKDNIWTSNDSAFVYTTNGYKNFKSPIFSNLYSVGTHNGNSKYAFTSMESAVQCGITFVNEIIPETKNTYDLNPIITLNYVILTIMILSIFLIIFNIYKKYNINL